MGSNAETETETETETQRKIEIQVRSLTGESINVPVEAEDTVQQLKLLLKQNFPPASNSPNFHLFLKVTSNVPPLMFMRILCDCSFWTVCPVCESFNLF